MLDGVQSVWLSLYLSPFSQVMENALQHKQIYNEVIAFTGQELHPIKAWILLVLLSLITAMIVSDLRLYSEAQIYEFHEFYSRKISFWNRDQNLKDEGHIDKTRAEWENYLWILSATSFVQF